MNTEITIPTELCTVIRLLNGSTKKKKDQRTLLSLRIHFLWYCFQRKTPYSDLFYEQKG